MTYFLILKYMRMHTYFIHVNMRVRKYVVRNRKKSFQARRTCSDELQKFLWKDLWKFLKRVGPHLLNSSDSPSFRKATFRSGHLAGVTFRWDKNVSERRFAGVKISSFYSVKILKHLIFNQWRKAYYFGAIAERTLFDRNFDLSSNSKENPLFFQSAAPEFS